MSMVYSEDDRMLADTAEEFLAAQSPVSAQRALRDNEAPLNFDPEIWQQMMELGWGAITFPEELGGLDFGYKGLGAVFEAMGKHLSASPMLSSVVLCGSLLQQLANDSQKEWLSAIIAGEKRLALAVDEQARHKPEVIETMATEDGDGFVLNGSKTMVFDGVSPDGWIVAAKHQDGVSLFIVPFSDDVKVSRVKLVDSRNYANLTFEQVKVPADALLGSAGQSAVALDKALDLGRLCLSSEILGAAKAIFAMTVEYLQVREQFAVKIGTFQALQHRAAKCFIELELAQSTIISALSKADSNADDFAASVSLAKWKLSKVADLVSGEAVQMHGGIGVTDELDVGLYLKRIRVAQMSLGDLDFHQARFATLMA